MFLTGYHGTKITYANEIISSGEFHPSKSKTDWLGSGIYYYFNIKDAYEWQDSDAILHSVIRIDESEFLDMDSDVGAKVYNGIIECIEDVLCENIRLSTEHAQENQCAVMRAIWADHPQIKVISASFATTKTKVRTLLDLRPRRREFCVRDNSCIKHTFLIKKGDLDD